MIFQGGSRPHVPSSGSALGSTVADDSNFGPKQVGGDSGKALMQSKQTLAGLKGISFLKGFDDR